MKKYLDIERAKALYLNNLEVGESIVIEEKIDGANCSFLYDAESDTVKIFSRRQELTPDNTLQGAYGWGQSLNKDVVREVLGNRYVVFGEWNCKHTVVYPDSCYKKFYMFDVWDTETEQYLPFKEAVKIYLDLTQDSPEVPFSFVPVLYVGFYESYEKLLELVGTTKLGGEMGEGIVIKRQGKLDSKSSRDPFYIKIVSEKFSEVHDSKPRKPVDPAVVAAAEVAQAEIATIVTERRVEKMILKLIDEGIIPSEWGAKDMGTIAKILPREIYQDCVKEEPEIVAKYENFGKIAGGLTMKYVKKMI